MTSSSTEVTALPGEETVQVPAERRVCDVPSREPPLSLGRAPQSASWTPATRIRGGSPRPPRR